MQQQQMLLTTEPSLLTLEKIKKKTIKVSFDADLISEKLRHILVGCVALADIINVGEREKNRN